VREEVTYGKVANDVGEIFVGFVAFQFVRPFGVLSVASGIEKEGRDDVRAVVGDEETWAVEGGERGGAVEGEELVDAALSVFKVIVEAIVKVQSILGQFFHR
jgi:hypothetical protein